MKEELLIIPDKADIEREKIANAWINNGGEVLKVGKFWVKPETGGKKVALYGYDSFCLVLAQVLELELYMPKDEWIAEVDHKFIKRDIQTILLQDAGQIVFPKFIKPVTPKLFKAAVFNALDDLMQVTHDIPKEEQLIISDIITVKKEVRSFILDKNIQDLAFYEGVEDAFAKLSDARNFIEIFLAETNIELPKTFVLDLGFNQDLGWFIIEFNSSWGAGLNFCDAEKVVHCIKAAVISA